MHFWNLTIDVISCVNLVIAVGLCIDYAAHIAHTFMVTEGTFFIIFLTIFFFNFLNFF